MIPGQQSLEFIGLPSTTLYVVVLVAWGVLAFGTLHPGAFAGMRRGWRRPAQVPGLDPRGSTGAGWGDGRGHQVGHLPAAAAEPRGGPGTRAASTNLPPALVVG